MRPTLPLAALLFCSVASAQDLPLHIDLSNPISPPVVGQLKMGGANPQGDRIDVNSRYITLNGKPWLPVMGEMHYSRYPREQWNGELKKMKAGGINVVSAYVFWIHHEEIEGQFDWTGNKDLGEFVRLCAKNGLYVWLRIGPWDHGEVRNGGFPDWLIAKFPNVRQLRTTNPQFMDETRKLYTQIFDQVKGQLYKDGGPIVGVQVENELRGDPNYLLALKNMAKEIGFDVPLYSMTGWGPARVPKDELLPMFGGYGDGFWIDGGTVSGQTRVQYFFTQNPNDERTRMTSAPGSRPASMSYLSEYPYLTCEIGGGMAISYANRPLMDWKDVAAVALNKLGNGSCTLGYYMYQGGANPLGKLSTLQEQESTKITNDNDMPAIHYDFQAPLGEFGQVRPVYHALRMLHMFVADFGSELCDMPATLPPVLPKDLNDTQTLRWEVRSDGHRGFIFIDNHERGVALPAKSAQFDLKTADGDQIVPVDPVSIPTDAMTIWPFNLDLNGNKLAYATAQLLCKLDGATPTYVFFAPDGVTPEFAFDPATLASVDGNVPRQDKSGLAVLRPGLVADMPLIRQFKIHSADGKSAAVILLTQSQALQCWKAHVFGADRLLFSSANLTWDDQSITAQADDPNSSVTVYPQPDPALSGARQISYQGLFPIGAPLPAIYALTASPKTVNVTVNKVADAGPARKITISPRRKPLPPSDADFDAAAVWHIDIPADALDGVADVRLKIDYAGDAARAYVGDRLIDDDYYFGRPWEIGLKAFAPDVLAKGITLKILPLSADNPAYIQPEFRPKPGADGTALELRSVAAEPVYQVRIGG